MYSREECEVIASHVCNHQNCCECRYHHIECESHECVSYIADVLERFLDLGNDDWKEELYND